VTTHSRLPRCLLYLCLGLLLTACAAADQGDRDGETDAASQVETDTRDHDERDGEHGDDDATPDGSSDPSDAPDADTVAPDSNATAPSDPDTEPEPSDGDTGAVEGDAEDDAQTDTTPPDDAPYPDIAGEWNGSWATTGDLPFSGDFSLFLEPHDGAVVLGDATFTGAPCLSFGFIDAVLERDGAFVAVLTDASTRVTITGVIDGESLEANFFADDAGICTGLEGELSATRNR